MWIGSHTGNFELAKLLYYSSPKSASSCFLLIHILSKKQTIRLTRFLHLETRCAKKIKKCKRKKMLLWTSFRKDFVRFVLFYFKSESLLSWVNWQNLPFKIFSVNLWFDHLITHRLACTPTLPYASIVTGIRESINYCIQKNDWLGKCFDLTNLDLSLKTEQRLFWFLF